MARAFSTLFSYKGSSYTAVVSQIDGVVKIYVPDESLHGILPQGRATFQSQQGLKINPLWLSPAQRLMLQILISIESSVRVTAQKAATET